jgi:peptide/nickel transport system permease protein
MEARPLSAYVVRRLIGAIPLLFLISLISYGLMGLAPGGPTAILSQQARSLTPAARQAYEAALGLDKPWFVQYFYWLKELVLHGSLGNSFVDQRPVIARIAEKLPITVELLSLALVMTLVVAIPIGVRAAVRRDSAFDNLSTGLALIGYGVPIFWLGILLIDLFAMHLRWFPASGLYSVGREGNPLDLLRHLTLPAATLAIVSVAGWLRYQRASMIEVLDAPYIQTARSKGLPERIVLWRHALRNALLPMITLLGLQLPGLVGGAYFIEYIFSIPGMGYLGINAIFQRDYPTVMGITMLSAVMVILGNLLADVLYAVADPRIRYD